MFATLGTVIFSGPPRTIAGDYERDTEGVYVRRRIGVTAAAQQRLRILNVAFQLHLPEITNPAHGDPVLSLIFLARYLVKYGRKAREAKLTPTPHLYHLANVVCHPIRFTRFVSFGYLSAT